MTDRSDADDDRVLAHARAGNTDALDELFRRNWGRAIRVARTITRDHDQAADFASEAFACVIAAMQRGGGPTERFDRYLATAVRNIGLRADGRYRQTHSTPLTDELRDGLVAVIDADGHDDALTVAFESLRSDWRRVLWLTEVDGLSHTEVADQLDSTAPAIAALAYRARRALRDAYLTENTPVPIGAGA